MEGVRVHGRSRLAGAVAVTLAVVLALGACGPDRRDGAGAATPVPAAGTPAPTGPPAPTAPAPTAPAPTAPCDEPGGCFAAPRHAGTFDATLVPGASGLAASRRNPGLLWLLDDRRGTSEVWVLTIAGVLLGAVTVDGLDAVDTEALAVGPCGDGVAGQTCVYVGDIGDNRRGRDHVAVHRFVEPDLSAGPPEAPVAAAVARLRYPDGPHDAEALLIDDDGVALIVTKAPFDRDGPTTGPARLYRAAAFADGTLEYLGTVDVPPPEQPLHSLVVGNVVTGGDYLDGQVLLRTYDQVLLYTAPDPRDGVETFGAWPVRAVPGALEPQSEAIAWDPHGCGYYTAGEQAGDLWFVACRP